MDDVAAQAPRNRVAETPDHPVESPREGKRQAPPAHEYPGMPVNLIGLGLIIAGILFMYFLNFVGYVIGLPMVLGGIVALFLTYRRRKLAA